MSRTQKIRSEPSPKYPSALSDSDETCIAQALAILEARICREAFTFSDPTATANYAKLKIAALPHEVFGVFMLDNQHRLIEFVELFRGTIDGASVYPREVVKSALLANAAAVIFTHNHPSGTPEPSTADRSITRRLKDALATVDIRVLDHIVVGGNSHVSMAERGWL